MTVQSYVFFFFHRYSPADPFQDLSGWPRRLNVLHRFVVSESLTASCLSLSRVPCSFATQAQQRLACVIPPSSRFGVLLRFFRTVGIHYFCFCNYVRRNPFPVARRKKIKNVLASFVHVVVLGWHHHDAMCRSRLSDKLRSLNGSDTRLRPRGA